MKLIDADEFKHKWVDSFDTYYEVKYDEPISMNDTIRDAVIKMAKTMQSEQVNNCRSEFQLPHGGIVTLSIEISDKV